MSTRFPRLFATLTGLQLRLSERDRLRAELRQARAQHKPTSHILSRLRVITTDELAQSVQTGRG